MKAYIFPGQGVQCVGMGRALYDASASMRARFQQADRLLEMKLTDLMFNGPADALKETTVAQPAIFICSILLAEALPFPPAAVAGHSLGELTALVASRFLSFEDGLELIAIRARAMQEACRACPGTMAAVLGLADEAVEAVCASIVDEIVVPANYNCPGQLVISGSKAGVAQATKALLQAGARRIIPLEVEGGFHSPLMEMAQGPLKKAVDSISFSEGICPLYQNVTGLPTTEPETIKKQLVEQLVAPVYWTKTIRCMTKNGITECIEPGPGNVLTRLVQKINAP
ncbi:MAG TPA: ACP S-malonyltransferase [Amoebophilaceae bacterium]|nr:ACP S-malonyltransferase [Amoebophilaceae bacterium]